MKISELVKEYPELLQANFKQIPISEIMGEMGYHIDCSNDYKFESINEYEVVHIVHIVEAKLEFDDGNLTPESQLKYAEYVLENNPVKSMHIDYMSGNDPKHKPHSIDQEVWKKAWNNVKDKIIIEDIISGGIYPLSEWETMKQVKGSKKEDKKENEDIVTEVKNPTDDIMKIYEEDRDVLQEVGIKEDIDKELNVDVSLNEVIKYNAKKMKVEVDRLKYDWATNFTKTQKIELAKAYKDKKTSDIKIKEDEIKIRASKVNELNEKLNSLISHFYEIEDDNGYKEKIKAQIKTIEQEIKAVNEEPVETKELEKEETSTEPTPVETETEEKPTEEEQNEGSEESIDLGMGYSMLIDNEIITISKDGAEVKTVPNIFKEVEPDKIKDFFVKDLGISEDSDETNEEVEQKSEVEKKIDEIMQDTKETSNESSEELEEGTPEAAHEEELAKLKEEIDNKKEQIDTLVAKLIDNGQVNISSEELRSYTAKGESAIYAKEKILKSKLKQLSSMLFEMNEDKIKLIESVFINNKKQLKGTNNINSILTFLNK